MTSNGDVRSLARKIGAALSREEVSFAELFTDDFMRQHTWFPSFISMAAAAGARTSDELRAMIQTAVWEQHVTTKTSFASWEEMQQEAFAAWLSRQVDES
jgi:hypothetical protein